MRLLAAALLTASSFLLVACDAEESGGGIVIVPRVARDAGGAFDPNACAQGDDCVGAPSGGGDPCTGEDDCESGECGRVPGGYCVALCESVQDCGRGTACVRGPDGRQSCLQVCLGNNDCRAGWICIAEPEHANTCRPSCSEVGCPSGSACIAATGQCAALDCIPEEERCDRTDNDCDGAIDEKVSNACGGCGAPPREVCNDIDDDCDGSVDEGVRNSCGGCGADGVEACNGRDDDCDGSIDEGVLNACGGCGASAAEVCNGRDEDCDGRVDERATCADGSTCAGGRCAGRAGPAGACTGNADCESGLCDGELPGGFCVQQCNRDSDCAGGHCLDVGAGERWCIAGCVRNNDCRNGWICADSEVGGVCFPHCGQAGCDAGTVCDPSGLCVEATYTVRMSTVTIRPYIESDKTHWDGPGNVQDLVRDIAVALGVPLPVAAIIDVIANRIFEATAPPDAFGTVTLEVGGISYGGYELPTIDNEFRPTWHDVEWSGVPINPASNVRLTLALDDEDINFDDQIGQVVVGNNDWQVAATRQVPIQVNTSAAGSQNILFVEIEAILER